MIRSFVLPAMPDRLSQRVVDGLMGLLADLLGEPFLSSGRLLEGIACTAGVVRTIDHGLGRRARGWVEVTPADATARVGLAPSYTADLDLSTQLRVTPTATGTCSVWVY